VFGATVGIDRVLKLLDKYSIKATWFVPGHSVESFPSQIRKVVDQGHEIGLHGYTHEFVGMLDEKQQRAVLAKSIQVLTDFCGKKPKGWTAPAWSTSKESVSLLEEFGIEYDHSFMHHDSQLYYLPHHSTFTVTNMSEDPESWMHPMSTLRPSSIVEIPANWQLDDWPPFQLNLSQASTHGFIDTRSIERLWKDQFDYLYRECPEDGSFVFPISIHPDVSGKPQVVLMHERLIEYFNTFDGVEWVTMEQMVKEFKDGKIQGAKVLGGADV
jgi:peptidoglycan/xylan/chitin deacetylase (PgdA/CDA1 family)